MSRLSIVNPKSSDELQAVCDEVSKSRGWVSNALISLGHAPEGMRRFAAVGDYARYHTELTERVRELAIIAIGRSSQYEIAHHGRLAAQAGVSEDTINDILAGRVPTTISDEERAAVQYVLEFGSAASVSDATFAELRKYFSERSITDLTLVVAYYLAVAHTLLAFKVELESAEKCEIERSWQKAFHARPPAS